LGYLRILRHTLGGLEAVFKKKHESSICQLDVGLWEISETMMN